MNVLSNAVVNKALRLLSAVAVLSTLAHTASAVTITVKPTADSVQNLTDGIVYLVPLNEKGEEEPLNPTVSKAHTSDLNPAISQHKLQFTPYVSVITTGTEVRFPNNDSVAHHVYSFSKAKRFELPLYQGESKAPIMFDRPGVIVLGCNIHDWMVSYVVVVNTPFHSKLTENHTQISAPPGKYRMNFWHPGLKGRKPVYRDIKIAEDSATLTFELTKTVRPMPQASAPEVDTESGDY